MQAGQLPTSATTKTSAVTKDQLMEAFTRHAMNRDLPAHAIAEAVAETETACGYALPPLLKRLFTEVATAGH
jgi:hypothetical protein